MSSNIEQPLKNGFCDKCQHYTERLCKAYAFAGRLADCFFVACCEKFKEREG